MAGFANPQNPYDFGSAIMGGFKAGREERADRWAKPYLEQGDYEAAAAIQAPYNMEKAESYLQYGDAMEKRRERKEDKQYSRDLAPYVANDDWEGASEFALKNNRGADEIVTLRKMAKQAQTDELEIARQNSEDFAGALYALGELPDDQYMPAFQATLEQYGAKGADVAQYQKVQTPAAARAAARSALMRNMKAKEIFDLELDSRKTDVAERRADAAELTANAAWERANRSGGGGPKWRRMTAADNAAYGITDNLPRLIDDETGNVKPLGGGGAQTLAGAEQRGRIALVFPNVVQAQADLATLESAALTAKEGKGSKNATPYGNDWGARIAEAVPFDGGSVARMIGGSNYQAYETASKNFEQSIMPIFSGSAVTESEAQRFVRANMPRMGDDQNTLKSKALNRARIINSAATILGEQPPYPEAGYWEAGKGVIAPTVKNDMPGAGAPAAQGPVRIQSDADYNALAPGTQYFAPDGSVRTKR